MSTKWQFGEFVNGLLLSWIAREGFNENISFDCDSRDVCDLKNSYLDFNVMLNQPMIVFKLYLNNFGINADEYNK